MTTVCKFDDLVDGAAACHVIDGVAVAVVRIGDNVHAIDDVCSHANVSLSEGEVWPDACTLECPKHGSAFSLTSGEPDTLPATVPVRVHQVSIVDGNVNVELSA